MTRKQERCFDDAMVINYVRRFGPCSTTMVVKMTRLSVSIISQKLNRFVKNGILEKSYSHDEGGRKVAIFKEKK